MRRAACNAGLHRPEKERQADERAGGTSVRTVKGSVRASVSAKLASNQRVLLMLAKSARAANACQFRKDVCSRVHSVASRSWRA